MNDTQIQPDAAVDQLIGDIAEEFTQRLLRGERPDIEEYARKHPGQSEILRQVLPMLCELRSADGTGLPPAASSVGHESQPVDGVLGDFRILREIGRGGMGVVFEAEQISLRRRVALKVLPLASVLDERRLTRFRNEALAAAQLDHPHIVDVLGVGCDRGVHYYAMRYIEGQTLAQIIEARQQARGIAASQRNISATVSDPPRTDERNGRDTEPIAGVPTQRPNAAPARFLAIAEMMRNVAEALDHAHQGGIVHRDIKPSNLIIDTAGKAWVCDFGLAQVESDGATLTRTGDLIGTLRFLRPEQVSCTRVVVDHRIDLYALGATMYEALTLRPAIEAATREDLLRRIAAVEPKPPRRIDPQIPSELEIIALKAMAKNPAERYATARDFADDVQRFLDDKPIRARRPTVMQRLSRWSRHHRQLVCAAIVLCVLTSIGLAAASFVIESARRDAVAAKMRAGDEARRAERARLEAERWRRIEEENFHRAMQAVDLMLTRVAQNELASTPGMIEAHRELLEKALEIYRQFLNQRGDDPEVHLETTKAYGRVGEILLLLGRRRDSQRAFRKVIELARPSRANSIEYQIQLAVAHHNMGVNEFAVGKLARAERSYLESLAVTARLSPQSRRDFHIRRMLVASHNNLGNVVGRRGELKAAERHYRRALAEVRELARDFPREAHCRSLQATVHCSLGQHLDAIGRRAEAERHIRAACKLQEELVRSHPAVLDYAQLARTCSLLAGYLRRRSEFKKSADYYRRAIRLQTKLWKYYETVPRFTQEVARVYSNHSLLLRKTGPLSEALKQNRKALELRRHLATRFPDAPEHRLEVARSRRYLAVLLMIAKDRPAARAELADAMQTLKTLVKRYPKRIRYRADLAETHLELGKLLLAAGDDADAEQQLKGAAGEFASLVAGPKATARHRSKLVKAKWWLGMFHVRHRDFAAAADLFAANVAAGRRFVADFPRHRQYHRDLAGSLYNLGLMRLRLRQPKQAGVLFRDNLQIYAELMKQAPPERYRRKLLATLFLWGRLLHSLRHRATDGVEALALSSSAAKSGHTKQSRLWFDRAGRLPAGDRDLYRRILKETILLTGFPPAERGNPVVAPKPRREVRVLNSMQR